jgi:hypothetical protein
VTDEVNHGPFGSKIFFSERSVVRAAGLAVVQSGEQDDVRAAGSDASQSSKKRTGAIS